MKIYEYGDPDKPALLLIHGLSMIGNESFEPLLPLLTPHFRPLVINQDGHEPGIEGDFISLAESARQIEAYLLEHHNGACPYVYGLSMGAGVVLRMLWNNTIRFRHVIMDGAFVLNLGILSKPVSSMTAALMTDLVHGKHNLGAKIPAMVLGVGDSQNHLKGMGSRISRTSINNAMYSLMSLRWEGEVNLTPVSFLYGSEERQGSQALARRLKHQSLPSLQARCFEGYGHAGLLGSAPEKWAQKLVSQFIDE